VFIEVKDDGSGGDSWSYKSCKAPFRSSPPTNQHPVFLQVGCPSSRPTNSVKALKGLSDLWKNNLVKQKSNVVMLVVMVSWPWLIMSKGF